MLRMIITYILPLVLPTVLYFAWTLWVRKQVQSHRAQAAANGGEGDHTEVTDYEIKTPWFRLILAGVVLMMVGLVLSVFLSPKNPPQSTYQPPHLQGDTIVPGQYVPKSK